MTKFAELKKKQERFFGAEAAKLMGKTWSLGLDREHPDFLVTEGALQFGLEVCEIFIGSQNKRGSAMKEIESNAHRTVDALRREYEAITNIPLIVKLVGDVCAANLALVVPALIAEDLASKPVTYRAVIVPDTAHTGQAGRPHPGDAVRSAAAAGSDGRAAINRYWLLKLGRNHREDQPCRTHRASSHKRLPSARLCSGATRAALHSNPDTWDTRSCPPAAPR